MKVILLGRESVLKDGWRAVKMKKWISTGIINGSVIVKGASEEGKVEGAGTLVTKSTVPFLCLLSRVDGCGGNKEEKEQKNRSIQ